MGDPRDPVDHWLNAEVEPLPPRPGAFERISRRAHRRKVMRASMSAAGVAVVIAVAAAAPGIVSALKPGGGRPVPPVAASSPRPTAAPAVTGNGSGGLSSQSSSPVPTAQTPASLVNQGPLPGNFQPTSVTFIGVHTGAVIGQAGTQGHCASTYCTSLAGTTNYGGTWFGVSAPHAGPPDGAQGVGQLRFLDTDNGWAFGPQLWVTHSAGAHWVQEQTDGMRVIDLETAGKRAFALFAKCSGSGADFGTGCGSVSLYTSTAAGDRWQRVSGPAASLPPAAAGQAASASLVLAGGRGYLLAPSGELLSGPLTGAAWTVADAQVPCLPGAPGAGGQPTGALMAAGSGELILVCTSAASTAGDSQTKVVMRSSNGGTSWSTAGDGPEAGIATSVAAAEGNVVVLATDAGLDLSTNGGVSWQLARSGPVQARAGLRGFSYVGMTSASQGVALPADPGLHEVFITSDGGATWQISPL
ncbi:MAG TPA: hypothetical protein VMC03_12395 [Streptosporangiaceae bacterium]|nr:hypothetical protein [Streptosporangiaceae bacterium]